jgi:hypothetical protein
MPKTSRLGDFKKWWIEFKEKKSEKIMSKIIPSSSLMGLETGRKSPDLCLLAFYVHNTEHERAREN